MKQAVIFFFSILFVACHPIDVVELEREVSNAEAQPHLIVQVDPRIELFSLLFRAAEVPPYVSFQMDDTPYGRAAQAKINAMKTHPAVAATRRLYKEYAIGYDAPMSLAVHLE